MGVLGACTGDEAITRPALASEPRARSNQHAGGSPHRAGIGHCARHSRLGGGVGVAQSRATASLDCDTCCDRGADLVVYLQHVLFHSIPALSRLHSVHHADSDFDLTTGVRFHPLEIVLSSLIKLAAVAALGAPVLAVLIFELLINATAMFNHANVSLPGGLEPWVRRALVTPDMHRIHHSVIEVERNSNYGFCLSIWDRLLGTYTPAPRGDLDIGLLAWRDKRIVATLPGLLGMPFR